MSSRASGAHQATRDRDALRRRVADWLSEYRAVARVALRAHPDWLERIGVLARSEK